MAAGTAIDFSWTHLWHWGHRGVMTMKNNHRYCTRKAFPLRKRGGYHKQFYLPCKGTSLGNLKWEASKWVRWEVQAVCPLGKTKIGKPLCQVHKHKRLLRGFSVERVCYQYPKWNFRWRYSIQSLIMSMALFLFQIWIKYRHQLNPHLFKLIASLFCVLLIYSTGKCMNLSHPQEWNIIFAASYNLFVLYMQWKQSYSSVYVYSLTF